MKIVKSNKLYVCCGKYVAILDSVKDENVYCPRCGCKLEKNIELPIVLVAKRS